MRAYSLTRGTIAETPYSAEDMALDAALKLQDDPYAMRRPGEEHVPDAYWRVVLADVDRGEDYRAPVPREDGSE